MPCPRYPIGTAKEPRVLSVYEHFNGTHWEGCHYGGWLGGGHATLNDLVREIAHALGAQKVFKSRCYG